MPAKELATLEEVKSQFRNWRLTRTHKTAPIPEKLWDAAVALTGKHSLHKISTVLKVNHTALRDQAALRKQASNSQTQPCFLELPPPAPFPQSECLVEMKNKHGEKMRMHFTGNVSLDLLALSNGFWSK